MRTSLVLAGLLLSACPTPSNPDSGSGGGGGGGSIGGSGGGTGGGSLGGGVATGGGATGGGTAGGGGGALGGGGGMGGGDADSGIPTIPLAQFCATYASLSCAQLAACGQYESATSPSCLREQNRLVQSLCAQAMSGTLVYDGAEGLNCLGEITGTPLQCYVPFWSCGMLRTPPSGSQRAVFNARPNGCGAATCNTGACDESCTGPACQPFRSIGQPCNELTHPIMKCDPAAASCLALDGGAPECVPRANAGESCEFRDCLAGTRCNYAASPTPRCEPLLDAGTACQPGDPCDDGVCRSDGVCGARPLGAACAGGNDCGDGRAPNICKGLVLASDGGVTTMGQCAPRPLLGEACDYAWGNYEPCRVDLAQGCIDGTCRQLTPFSQPAGTECPIRSYGRVEAPFYGFAICARGLACLPSTTAHAPKTGRCGTPRQPGEACKDVFQCANGNNCLLVPDGGRECVHINALGEDCASRGCRSDTYCKTEDDGGARCAFKAELDAGCAASTPCANGLFCSSSSGVCEPIDVVGMPCSYEFECNGLACSNGQCVAMCIR